MTTLAPGARQTRTDIQAARGFAVLIVLFYHAKLGFLPAGYLGVDIFFVISGFLITRLIKKGIEGGDFRFSDFYFRRAKRLLPAAYVTFLATALLAPLFLVGPEMKDFRAQMIGAVTFTANIVLRQQSGYFGGAAELKPLLHVWSLSIEEQYYFVLPAMMAFVPRRFWLKGAVFVLLASLALCLARSGNESTFYLLPTRAWELMVGSVGALVAPGKGLTRMLRIAFWPALVVVIGLPLLPSASFHPGPEAMAICLGTLVLILRRHPALFDGIGPRVLARVGDMSYSLYLVHWPLFAFLSNAWIAEEGSQEPTAIRIGLIGLALLLAYVLNRYVEEPLRHADIARTLRVLAYTVTTSFSLVLLTFGIAFASSSDRDYAHLRRLNYGFGIACQFKDNRFEPLPECRNSDEPELLVWGDSYAMHLVPGLLKTAEGAPAMVQATRSACGPFLGVAAVERKTSKGYDPKWAESCIDFNDSVFAYLKQAPSVRTIVLSSPFESLINNERYQLLKRDGHDGRYGLVEAGSIEAVEGMKRTVDAVRALGKRVVVVAPPPGSGFDIGRCTERLESGLVMMGVANECRISIDAYRKKRGRVLDFLATLPQQAGVEVIRFDDFLCESDQCRTYISGTSIYRDKGHLSHDGSALLANEVHLLDKIKKSAR